MKFRFLLISVVVALMVMMPAAISAQDINTCFNLAEADCVVIEEANANLAFFGMTNDSFAIEYDLSFVATGLPEEMAGATSATFNSTGGIDIVTSGNGDVPLTIGAVFDNEFGTGEMLTSLPIEIRFVDSYLYFLNPMTSSWQGLNLVEQLDDPEFSEQIEDMNPFGGSGDADASMPDVESLIALTTILDLPGFINYTREGNDFVFTMDLTALGTLAQPGNEDKLAAITEILNEVDAGAGDDIAEFIQLIPMLLEEGTIVIVQSVNPELEIVDHIGFDMFLTINAAMMGAPDPIDVDLVFDMNITNINAAPSAVAPAEWEEIDPAELMGGF